MPTDQTPLFTHSKPSNPSTLDATIEHCIGEFSWTQLLQATLVSFAWFFDAQQSFISVFTDAEPKWTCKPNHPSCINQTLTTNICNLPSDSWSWTRPISTSIISEWSLQCSGSIITGLPASSFFLGCLFGGFVLATLADSSLGRKNMLVISTLVMSISGVLTAFSTNIYVYIIFRFVSGFGRSTVTTCALVLSTEVVGKKWRGGVGVLGFVCFTFGFLSLPLVAFLGRSGSWRFVYLWTCVPSVFYSLLVWLFVRESPRWLFVKGRKDEFVETLTSMAAPSNRSSLTMSFFYSTCTACDMLLLYTLELFPTCLRNSAMSMVRQALVFGGILSPVLVAAGRKNGLMLSYGVFGLMIILCGMFVLCLPETRGRVICDTIEEEEQTAGLIGNGVNCI